jgi:hypothetical protein
MDRERDKHILATVVVVEFKLPSIRLVSGSAPETAIATFDTTTAPKAPPSRKPSPLYPPCPQPVPSALLSGQVRPAPPLPASPRPGATLPPRRARRASRPWPSLASTAHTRAPWYDSPNCNWRHSDGGGWNGAAMARSGLG